MKIIDQYAIFLGLILKKYIKSFEFAQLNRNKIPEILLNEFCTIILELL